MYMKTNLLLVIRNPNSNANPRFRSCGLTICLMRIWD